VEVPVELPHVTVTVAANGTMSVAVNGQEFPPPPFSPPWQRSSFATILDTLIDQWRCPLRVQVTEADGTTFTDIITPVRPKTQTPVPPPAPMPTPPPALVEVSGEGFIPGEDVAVALILTHTDATGDGIARALLTAPQASMSPTGEVVLLGRISGTVAVERAR
jgi:hypothetical protein